MGRPVVLKKQSEFEQSQKEVTLQTMQVSAGKAFQEREPLVWRLWSRGNSKKASVDGQRQHWMGGQRTMGRSTHCSAIRKKSPESELH